MLRYSNIRQRLEIRTLENMHRLVESEAAKTSKDKENAAKNLKGLIKVKLLKWLKKNDMHPLTRLMLNQKQKKRQIK
jgi:hypothetical protein